MQPRRHPSSLGGLCSIRVLCETASDMTDVQPADRNARRVALLILGVGAIAGAAGLIALDRWLESLRQLEPAVARKALSQAMFWLTAQMVVVAAAFGAYGWRLGGKVIAAQRFPPPGSRVIRPTVIVTGEAARIRGRAMQFVGVALVALAILLWTTVRHLVARLT